MITPRHGVLARPGAVRVREVRDAAAALPRVRVLDSSPVSSDYTPHTSAFSGEVNWVEVDVGKEVQDADHFFAAEERFHIAMARQ